MAFLAN